MLARCADDAPALFDVLTVGQGGRWLLRGLGRGGKRRNLAARDQWSNRFAGREAGRLKWADDQPANVAGVGVGGKVVSFAPWAAIDRLTLVDQIINEASFGGSGFGSEYGRCRKSHQKPDGQGSWASPGERYAPSSRRGGAHHARSPGNRPTKRDRRVDRRPIRRSRPRRWRPGAVPKCRGAFPPGSPVHRCG